MLTHIESTSIKSSLLSNDRVLGLLFGMIAFVGIMFSSIVQNFGFVQADTIACVGLFICLFVSPILMVSYSIYNNQGGQISFWNYVHVIGLALVTLTFVMVVSQLIGCMSLGIYTLNLTLDSLELISILVPLYGLILAYIFTINDVCLEIRLGYWGHVVLVLAMCMVTPFVLSLVDYILTLFLHVF